MSDDRVGPSAPIVSVRPGRNRLADEDRALQAAKRQRQKKKQYDDHGMSGEDGGLGHGAGHSDIDDDVRVFGIPKDELTDNVRQAIQLLLDEINHLRGELVRAKGHEAYLEDQAEKDRLLHVMRRRAFMARLSLSVRRVEEEKAQFSFLYIQVKNAQFVRNGYGHGAFENLMMQAANALRDGVEAGDVIGSLENADFGVLMPGTPLEICEGKAAQLVATMAAQSFSWQGQPLGVQVAFGSTLISAGDNGEDIIVRARDNLQARALVEDGDGSQPT